MNQVRFRDSALPSVVFVLIQALILAVISAISIPVVAQSATGQILGTVTDSTSAVIPNAVVTITNTATNQSSTVKTSAAGSYLVSQLIPGPYKIRVEAPGFATSVVKVESLQVNEALNQIIALKAGSASETVEVTSNGEVMQTASSEVGVVVDPEQVHDIPLNGRNFTTLINLAPGAGPVATSRVGSHRFRSYLFCWYSGEFSRSASDSGPVEPYELLHVGNGAINSSAISSSYVVLPMIDSIQEFKVQSHSDNAEFGGVLGGVVNVVTKSGANAFHGAGWEYNRNGIFDARTAYTGVSGLNQNQFGGLLSGPVRIPWLYNGKDRSFFTFGYEGWRYTSNLGAHYLTVPTAAELSGDFSNSLLTHTVGTANVPNVVYDPTQAPRTPFPRTMRSRPTA